jgi:hypothetical protein
MVSIISRHDNQNIRSVHRAAGIVVVVVVNAVDLLKCQQPELLNSNAFNSSIFTILYDNLDMYLI